jgi:hypothetical protein
MYNNTASRAYHLREFCGGGNSEPNDTLKNVECSETTTSRPKEPAMPYLFPKEVRKIKGTPGAPAKTQQAGKHDG